MNNLIEKSRAIVENKSRFNENIVSLAVNYLISNDKDFTIDNV